MILHRQIEGFCKTDDTIHVLRARAHISFLRPAEQQWMNAYIVPYIQDANAFRTMELVAGAGNEVNQRPAEIDGIMTDRLNTIGMKNSVVLPAKVAHGIEVKQVADLIICMHQ